MKVSAHPSLPMSGRLPSRPFLLTPKRRSGLMQQSNRSRLGWFTGGNQSSTAECNQGVPSVSLGRIEEIELGSGKRLNEHAARLFDAGSLALRPSGLSDCPPSTLVEPWC